MAEASPTFVIGIGKAGAEIVLSLKEIVERNDDEDMYDYMVLDTDRETLKQVPRDVTRSYLELPNRLVNRDKVQYPYLTTEMDLGATGAQRQRPVGRYKLDNDLAFQQLYRQIKNQILDHLEEAQLQIGSLSGSYNIFLIHSLSGGTGSGTFPLLASMIHWGAKEVNDDNVDVYFAGVGVLPEVPAGVGEGGQTLYGYPIYYPNSYAALNDLKKLLDADTGDPLHVPFWADVSDVQELLEMDERNSILLDDPPFNDYWLVGVNEEKIGEGHGSGFAEPYTEMIDIRVAEAIHAISQLGGGAENWWTNVTGYPRLGAMGQSEVRIPHDRIKEYCRFKESKGDLIKRVEKEIPTEIDDIQVVKRRLEDVRENPMAVMDQTETALEIHDELRGRFETTLSADRALLEDNEPSDFDEELSTVASRYDPPYYHLATHILSDMLEAKGVAPAVEAAWNELVSNQWNAWNMTDKTRYGGPGRTTVQGKAKGLEEFYDDKINEWEEQLEELRPTLRDLIPPVLPIFESKREELEHWLKFMRSSRRDLHDMQAEWEHVSALRDVIYDHRQRARRLVSDEIMAYEEEIQDLHEERDELRKKLANYDSTIQTMERELTQEEVSRRLGILPIEPDRIDDLTLNKVEYELTSLANYVEKGFVNRETVVAAVEDWYSHSRAWNDSVIRTNWEGIEHVPPHRELWILYHKDNEEFADIDIVVSQELEQKRSEGAELDYLNDPYSIEFITFSREGVVEALEHYQKLDKMAEEGTLDAFAGKFNDHRKCFAYPEMYDREIRRAFQINEQLELPKPIEPSWQDIGGGSISEGERKNYLKTHLEAFLWAGVNWEEYHGDGRFFGWRDELQAAAVTYRDLQRATADTETKSRWLSEERDDITWEDPLEEYRDNLIKNEGIEVSWAEPV